MKDKYSNAGKGDKSRVSDKKRFDKNWDKIFGSINEKKTKKIKTKATQAEDVGLSDTHHKGTQEQKTQKQTARKD
jgi:hypothetical protein